MKSTNLLVEITEEERMYLNFNLTSIIFDKKETLNTLSKETEFLKERKELKNEIEVLGNFIKKMYFAKTKTIESDIFDIKDKIKQLEHNIAKATDNIEAKDKMLLKEQYIAMNVLLNILTKRKKKGEKNV